MQRRHKETQEVGITGMIAPGTISKVRLRNPLKRGRMRKWKRWRIGLGNNPILEKSTSWTPSIDQGAQLETKEKPGTHGKKWKMGRNEKPQEKGEKDHQKETKKKKRIQNWRDKN